MFAAAAARDLDTTVHCAPPARPLLPLQRHARMVGVMGGGVACAVMRSGYGVSVRSAYRRVWSLLTQRRTRWCCCWCPPRLSLCAARRGRTYCRHRCRAACPVGGDCQSGPRDWGHPLSSGRGPPSPAPTGEALSLFRDRLPAPSVIRGLPAAGMSSSILLWSPAAGECGAGRRRGAPRPRCHAGRPI